MMEETIRVLSIEDNELDRMALQRLVEEEELPYDLTFARSVAEARDILSENDFDVALVDYLLGDGTAFDLFDDLKGMPFIIVTGTGDESVAVEAMRQGAYDYIVKDPNSDYLIALPLILEAALTHWRNERQLARYREHLEEAVVERTAQLRRTNQRLRQEIEERKRAQEEREASERKFRALFNNLSDAVFIHDLQGTFLEVNDVACQRLGYSREELLQMGLGDIDAPEEAAVAPERMEETKEDLRALFRTEHVTRDGERIPTEVHSRLVHYNGQDSILSVARDISEREELEAQLRQAQKMESVGRLAGGIAHDFNNLLTVINGYSQLMLAEMPAGSPWRQEVEQIERAGTRAGDLTRQILAFSRRQILNPQTVQLNDLLLEMAEMLRRLIREDIELVTLPAPDLGLVEVDPGQMEQILTNLVVNASDAMSEKTPPGGTLTIATANETLDEDFVAQHPDAEPGEYVRLTVKDTGVGMTDEVKEHLFEPFFTTKEPGEGTGLGLATVYGIVKQQEGLIYIDSTLGEGTTVNVYLPRVEMESEKLSRRDEEGYLPRGEEKILLVEDEPSVLRFMRKALDELGYAVLEAANGEEALRVSEEQEDAADLLVTDVVMPQMDGRTLVERMRDRHPQLKVLYVSGYADVETISPADFGQRADFLQKPFSSGALAHKVRALLDA